MLSVPKSPKVSKSLLDNPSTPITRKLVLAQLEEMGYPRDVLPDAVIDAFLQEINADVDEDGTLLFKSLTPKLPSKVSNQKA